MLHNRGIQAHRSQPARPGPVARTLGCTNVIESAFSIVETVCRNVKRWRDGDHIERWVGSGLVVAERRFRMVIRYRQIPCCYLRWPARRLRNRLPNTPRSRNV